MRTLIITLIVLFLVTPTSTHAQEFRCEPWIDGPAKLEELMGLGVDPVVAIVSILAVQDAIMRHPEVCEVRTVGLEWTAR